MSECGFVSPNGRCGAPGTGKGGHCGRHGCPSCGNGKKSSAAFCDACGASQGGESISMRGEAKARGEERAASVERRMAASIAKVKADAVFNAAEKARLISRMVELQLTLEELLDVCDVVFVAEKRFRKPNSAAETAQGWGYRGTHRISGGQLVSRDRALRWDGPLGTTPDGRSMKAALAATHPRAEEVLAIISEAMERQWAGIAAEHAAATNGGDVAGPVESKVGVAAGGAPLHQHVPPELNVPADAATGLYPEIHRDALSRSTRTVLEDCVANLDRGALGVLERGSDLARLRTTIEAVLAGSNGARLYDYLKALACNNAAALKARLTTAVAGIAGAAVTAFSIKGQRRATQKMQEYRGNAGCTSPFMQYILDFLRISVSGKTIADMHQIYLAVKAEFGEPAACKERLGKPTHDVMYITKLAGADGGSGSGMLAEIQIHHADVLALKSFMHIPYEVVRASLTSTPAPNGLVQFSPWHAEELTSKKVKLSATFVPQ
eukprot:gene21822-963_t